MSGGRVVRRFNGSKGKRHPERHPMKALAFVPVQPDCDLRIV